MPQANIEERPGQKDFRRASDRSPLGSIVAGIEAAFSSGNFPLAAQLLEADLLPAWYGLTPDRLREIIAALLRNGIGTGGVIEGMGVFVGAVDPERFSARVQADRSLPPAETPPVTGPLSTIMTVARMFELRLEGRPVAALHEVDEVHKLVGPIQPLFDARGGWALFGAVQRGVTAMLAGDFQAAVTSLTEAHRHPTVPSLAFLTRDACVKLALLEALYGDAKRARALLREAEGISRTESWIEDVVDATAVIAVSMVAVDSPVEAAERLNAVSQRAIGEMWPFYAIALHRTLAKTQTIQESSRRLALVESLPLPRTPGEGFSGSALEIVAVVNAMALNDLATARKKLAQADSSLAVTRMVAGILDLVSGRPREVLRGLAGVHRQIQGLRYLEIWRLSLLAGAHLALGEQDDTRDVLAYAVDALGGLRPGETQYFSAEVQSFAESQWPEWPRPEQGENCYFDQFPNPAEALSARELDVVRDLASGLSREEIANGQFISLNTLKAHLRSIYRKLDVNSRAAAILEAERRGLL
ncbi:LuxR C-terminal-related transcriptional regulator [Leucobacter sp. W1153]|uniref:LuxR C-terminal-related transcriptional regulator n=1 Tax=Leucobacter sp. W1153 TaxID=3439064 RepID=UPI003F36E20D